MEMEMDMNYRAIVAPSIRILFIHGNIFPVKRAAVMLGRP